MAWTKYGRKDTIFFLIMQIKIAFWCDFFVKGVGCGGQVAVESLREVECARHRLCAFSGCGGGQQSCGVKAKRISRAEAQSAPQNAKSVSGTPQSITRSGKYSAGNRREQDSQEEGERQYWMYQSDRKGTRGEIREH